MDDAQRAAEAEAQRQRDIQGAYLAIFGPIGKPASPQAALILDDLERFTRHRDEALAVSPKAGMVDVHATIYRTGKQAVMKRIYARLTWKENSDGNRHGNIDRNDTDPATG